jgi:hypothetical protein
MKSLVTSGEMDNWVLCNVGVPGIAGKCMYTPHWSVEQRMGLTQSFVNNISLSQLVQALQPLSNVWSLTENELFVRFKLCLTDRQD